RRIRPWQRGVIAALVLAMGCATVGARGPGRAGLDDLMEEPDALPPTDSKVPPGQQNKTVKFIISLDPNLSTGITVPGSTVGALGQQPLTISLDAIRGGPSTMKLGDDPVIATSGELMVPLLGVTGNTTVNGKAATPG